MSNTKFASDGSYPAGSDAWSGQPRQVALTNSEAQAGFTPNTPVSPEVLNYLFACSFSATTAHTASASAIPIPPNVLYIDVVAVGGGGGGSGGAGSGNNNGGCGGGSGRVARARIPRNMLGSTYDVTVGAAGTKGLGGILGAASANVGNPGGLSSAKFLGPGDSDPMATFVQAAGGQGGQLLAGGAGYSGGGGAGTDAAGAGTGGALGGGGQDGGGGSGRTGGAGDTGISYLGVTSGAGCRGGVAATATGGGLQAGGGGGGGALGADNATVVHAEDGFAGTGTNTNGGKGGYGFGGGGGGGGQGTTGSGAGGNGAQGVVVVTFWRGIP